jgi:hypothetical protein
MTQIAAWIDALPRMARIVLTLLVTIFLALLSWLLLAEIVGGGITDPNPSASVSMVVILLGMVYYAAGWWALIGFERPNESQWQAGPPAVYFVGAGLLALLLIVIIVALLVA